MKSIILKFSVSVLTLCLSSLLISAAFAQDVLFDFDNAPLHSGLPISQTVNNITAQFTATGQGYSIQDANVLGFTPQGFSGRVIYPNSVFLADLLIKFDSTLIDFSIMYSCQELGCDDAATMRVTSYMNGNFIGTATKTATNPGTWPVDTLRCSFLQGFDSVVIHYDSHPPTCQDYGVIFMADKMRVTTYNILPVNLLYFNVENKGDAAVLQWRSADEINFSKYIVQYATNSSDFTDLTTINAKGANHDYSYTHPSPAGTVYYRLKMVDKNGACQYSEIKKLTFKTTMGIAVFPNPSNEYILVYCNSPAQINTIQIFSTEGIALKTISDYSCGQKIMLNDLPKGIYILKAFTAKRAISYETLFLKM